MRMAVFAPLLMLFCSSMFAQLLVMQNVGAFLDNTVDVGLPVQFFEFQLGTITLGFNLASGAILLAVTGITIAVVAGIRLSGSILGTGGAISLSETSVSAVTYGLVFFGAWLLLSLLGSPLILIIPIFGIPLYFLMTLIYVIGVLEMMHMNA